VLIPRSFVIPEEQQESAVTVKRKLWKRNARPAGCCLAVPSTSTPTSRTALRLRAEHESVRAQRAATSP
jgi:hypothetical protein